MNLSVRRWGEALLETDETRIGEVEALGLDETLMYKRGPFKTKAWGPASLTPLLADYRTGHRQNRRRGYQMDHEQTSHEKSQTRSVRVQKLRELPDKSIVVRRKTQLGTAGLSRFNLKHKETL